MVKGLLVFNCTMNSILGPIEKALAELQASVDSRIKDDQKEMKEQLISMSTFLGTLSTWIQSGGFSNLPRPFP